MRCIRVCRALVFALLVPAGTRAQEFNIPLRINLGGDATVDSNGNLWLGDPGANQDVLGIRVDPAGGPNAIANWSDSVIVPATMTDLGFDPSSPEDRHIFSTIRWDPVDAPDWVMMIPVPDGNYLINLYFLELGAGRHYKIEIQGEIVEADQFSDPGILTRKSFEDIDVEDGFLRIAMLPCPDPECPGAGDPNPILNALEVLSEDGCDQNGLNLNCSLNTQNGSVVATWDLLAGADSYRVLRNDQEVATLGENETRYEDTDAASVGARVRYRIQALDGGAVLQGCECSVSTVECPGDLSCDVQLSSGEVAISWTAPIGIDINSYRVDRNGDFLADVPGDATTFEDTPRDVLNDYVLTPTTDPPGQCGPLSCSVSVPQPFDVPLRINFGGPELVDSQGRTWLGDQLGPGDALSIRPDDAGGTESIPSSWCAPKNAQTIERFGFDSTDPNDISLLTSIRWDVGGDGNDFRLGLRIPDGEYVVNMYFFECCCPQRHFKVEIQGDIVAPDVHSELYDEDPFVNGTLGRFTFPGVIVDDGTLSIGLLPCPECPGQGDINAILSALEVFVPDPTFKVCPANLGCSIDGSQVSASWDAPLNLDVTGYRVLRNDEEILNLPGSATGFDDGFAGRRVAVYEVQALLGAAEDPCPPMRCTVANVAEAFAIPLRINMGGPSIVDSRGQLWIGDGPGAADALDIRPDDFAARNTVGNWCAPSSPDALRSLGFDPDSVDDVSIFHTIRWDPGDDDADLLIGEEGDFDGGDVDFRLAIPVPNGSYTVCLYWTECCCPERSFTVLMQGEVLEEEVNSDRYGGLGRTGRLCYEGIQVDDGILSIELLTCPFDCLNATNFDAMLSALEVLPGGTSVQTCPRDLTCAEVGAGTFALSWKAGENLDLSGYEIFRNGEMLGTAPANATTFEDEPEACEKIAVYEVVPTSDDPLVCGEQYGMSCTVVNTSPDCIFATPLRINMGGEQTVDSQGNLWLGDRPCTLAEADDPLGIRRDPFGGARAICDWCTPEPSSFEELGFDANHPGDQHIFTSIRWDEGADGIGDFYLDLPVEDGVYTVNLYFDECCCDLRFFKIDINGEIVDPEVSYLDYNLAPAVTKLGRLSFEDIEVEDQILAIGFLPCPECPGAADNNAIINAVEILPTGERPQPPLDVAATSGEDTVKLTWSPPAGGLAVTGYNVYQVQPGSRKKLTPLPVPITELNLSGLSPGEEVCYVVRSVSETGIESVDSTPACTTPGGGGGGFRRGDSDASGVIDISDPIFNLTFQFVGGIAQLPCEDAADVDGSNVIDISDPIYNLTFQFVGGIAPPPAPGPTDCGADPVDAADQLGCENYPQEKC